MLYALNCDAILVTAVQDDVAGMFDALPLWMNVGVKPTNVRLDQKKRKQAIEVVHVSDGLFLTPLTDRVKEDFTKVLFGTFGEANGRHQGVCGD